LGLEVIVSKRRDLTLGALPDWMKVENPGAAVQGDTHGKRSLASFAN
jgi:hypothetical protein